MQWHLVMSARRADINEAGRPLGPAAAAVPLSLAAHISLSHEVGHVGESGGGVHLHAVHILDVGAG